MINISYLLQTLLFFYPEYHVCIKILCGYIFFLPPHKRQASFFARFPVYSTYMHFNEYFSDFKRKCVSLFMITLPCTVPAKRLLYIIFIHNFIVK